MMKTAAVNISTCVLHDQRYRKIFAALVVSSLQGTLVDQKMIQLDKDTLVFLMNPVSELD